MQQYIYIVFSSTPYKIGKSIRVLTGQKYNHISICLDPELKEMYSFARRFYRTPFYGGFVKESLSRYDIDGKRARIRICRIPVTDQDYSKIQSRMQQMLRRQDIFLYNHLSVLGTPFQRSIRTKAAFTCVEFCVYVLIMAGMDLDPRKYYSISSLLNLLRPYMIFTGPIPRSEERDLAFFAKKPVHSPLLATARDILKLVPRIEK